MHPRKDGGRCLYKVGVKLTPKLEMRLPPPRCRVSPPLIDGMSARCLMTWWVGSAGFKRAGIVADRWTHGTLGGNVTCRRYDPHVQFIAAICAGLWTVPYRGGSTASGSAATNVWRWPSRTPQSGESSESAVRRGRTAGCAAVRRPDPATRTRWSRSG